MKHTSINIKTNGERFYNITSEISSELNNLFRESGNLTTSGILHLFITHTSCALTISESYDPSAATDMEMFLKILAPTSSNFITHTSEGSDDSPSHMKSILLQQSLGLIVEDGQIVLGTWQGIFLAEFRANAHSRKVLLKFCPDNI